MPAELVNKDNKNNSKWERTNSCVLPVYGEQCALLGGNGNTLKFKMTAKLKDIQTSIATVQDLLRTFATFPAPLLSHYRLPLNCNVLCVLVRGLIRKIRQLRKRFQDKEHLEDDVKIS
jgi:hypothetical protein